MPKVYLDETEKYPYYYVCSEDSGTEYEVDEQTLKRWQAAEELHKQVQEEMGKLFTRADSV